MQSDEWLYRKKFLSATPKYLFCWSKHNNQWEMYTQMTGFKLTHQQILEYTIGIPTVLSTDIWYGALDSKYKK